MFDLTYIAISLIIPLIFGLVCILLKDRYEFPGFLLFWVLIEHYLIAKILFLDPDKNGEPTGGFLSVSIINRVLALTLLVDYLIVAAVIYGILMR